MCLLGSDLYKIGQVTAPNDINSVVNTGVSFFYYPKSVEGQWLVQLPLVPEIQGLNPARDEENFGVQASFAEMTLDKCIDLRIRTLTGCPFIPRAG